MYCLLRLRIKYITFSKIFDFFKDKGYFLQTKLSTLIVPHSVLQKLLYFVTIFFKSRQFLKCDPETLRRTSLSLLVNPFLRTQICDCTGITEYHGNICRNHIMLSQYRLPNSSTAIKTLDLLCRFLRTHVIQSVSKTQFSGFSN